MNMQNPTGDPRFDPQANITKNTDGSYKITKTEVRMEVYPFIEYNQDKTTTLNQKELTAKGYMQSPNDWKNVEMAGYVKLISSLSNDQFNWYNRGGHHTNSAPCEGTAYKSDVMYYISGQTRFNKEHWRIYSTIFCNLFMTLSVNSVSKTASSGEKVFSSIANAFFLISEC
jgi:hypothetical protein